jgi:hypothetical protein
MTDVAPLPVSGTVVTDWRGAGRLLRISWHGELEVFVVSVWRDDHCVGTIQLRPQDVDEVVRAFTGGLSVAVTSSTGGSQPA